MLMTLMTGLLTFTFLFLGLVSFRYGLERSRWNLDLQTRRAAAP